MSATEGVDYEYIREIVREEIQRKSMSKAARDLLWVIANGPTHNGMTMWASKHNVQLQAGGDLQDRVKFAAREVSK